MKVLLIDGHSGSGKTTLAAELASTNGAQILSLEDLYPGWHGLAAGSRAVPSALSEGGYHPYDWAAGAFSLEWVVLDANRALIIEGCGAITKENLEASERWAGQTEQSAVSAERTAGRGTDGELNRPEARAVHSIWLDVPEPVRRARALARDAEMFAPHWNTWAAQEQAHFAVHQPWLHASEVRAER